ncbi:MAG: hypothetical protein QM800_10320 [Paludibacter sp.]
MKNLMITIALGCILSYGCSPIYYSPNTLNVPLISEKGETNLTLAGNGNQVEFQGAYGIANGFAMQANGGLFIPADLSNGNGGSGKFIELGGGYFHLIREHFVFETYGILGLGSMENHLPSTTAQYTQTRGNISASVFRYGIQPNFGFKSKYFAAAISSRIVSLNYSNIQGDLIFDGINQTDYLTNNRTNFLLEPAITIKGGFEKIKLQIQYGYSINLSNKDFKQDNSFLTLGLNFTFK